MDPLATAEEVAGDNGDHGGAARGTPANSGHGGPIRAWREHQGYSGKPREGRGRRERAPVVVVHGEHNSDAGGNGAPLRRRRKTVPTLTLLLRGEMDELQMMMMESWASRSEKRGNGEGSRARRSNVTAVAFLGGSSAREKEIEGECECDGRRARPSSVRQRATASGRPWRVAATRRTGAVTGRHCAEFKISVNQLKQRVD